MNRIPAGSYAIVDPALQPHAVGRLRPLYVGNTTSAPPWILTSDLSGNLRTLKGLLPGGVVPQYVVVGRKGPYVLAHRQ
jgi:hypothetical protein